MSYQSFSAREPNEFFFHVWWLKEFKNRWFAVGIRKENGNISNLALDRIVDISLTDEVQCIENENINSEEYYKNVIGITVNNLRPMALRIFVVKDHAPYVETKPLHHS